MAGNGLFRSSFRGFNRQDVLDYIDTLCRENEQQLQALQEQMNAQNARLVEAEQARAAAEAEIASLTEQNDQLEALIDEHNRANRELRAQIEELNTRQQGQSQLELDNARLLAVNATLREQQSQYQAVTGRLQNITDEMRKHSLNFLGTSCKRSEECLDTMEKLVADYESQLAETRRRIGEARAVLEEQKDAAGVHLDELIQEILEGKPLPASAAPKSTVAQPAAANPVNKPRLMQQPKRSAPRRSTVSWLANLLK
ncbi:MAG: hypothetical protein IJC17_02620 [Clostridia bacterium]|nr:hypothetical protein [Clostridia bacterium]